ncbi:hypothetical protein P7C70_g2560, partial [Phenoliferia sp. Uapishka_3]
MERLDNKPSSAEGEQKAQNPAETPMVPGKSVDRRQVEDAEALLSFANSPTSPHDSPATIKSEHGTNAALPTPTSAETPGATFARRFSQPQPPSHAFPHQPTTHYHPHPHAPAPRFQSSPAQHYHPYASHPHAYAHPYAGAHFQSPPLHPHQHQHPFHHPHAIRPILPPIQTGRAPLPPQVYYESPPQSPSASGTRESPDTKAGHEARYDEAVRLLRERTGATNGLGVVGEPMVTPTPVYKDDRAENIGKGALGASRAVQESSVEDDVPTEGQESEKKPGGEAIVRIEEVAEQIEEVEKVGEEMEVEPTRAEEIEDEDSR